MLEELELLDLVGKMITGPAVSHFLRKLALLPRR